MSVTQGWFRLFLCGVATAAGLSSIAPASAYCIAINPATYTNQKVYLDLGQIVVPSNLPVGATIITRSYPVTRKDNYFSCSIPYGESMARVSYSSPWFFRAVPGMDSVTATDVPGIGIRIRQSVMDGRGAVVSTYYPAMFYYAPGQIIGIPGDPLVVELIKTASVVGSGQIFPPGFFFASHQIWHTPDSFPVLAIYLNQDSGIIKSGTCAPTAGSKNVAVTFGSVSRNAFAGIGTTAASRDFDIELECQGFDPAGAAIGVRVDALQDASSLPGVMPLTASADTATGVAIEIVQRGVQGERPLRFGEGVILTGAAGSAGRLVLPLRARYIQTSAAKVTSGKANGLATFTIQYN